MDAITCVVGAWALVASVLAWLCRRVSLAEAERIVALLQHARDELSEGGQKITADEALEILDALIHALKMR